MQKRTMSAVIVMLPFVAFGARAANTRSARSVARHYAQERAIDSSTVTIEPRPVLREAGPNPLTAWRLRTNGRLRNFAVLVRRDTDGHQHPLGVAEIHKVPSPKGKTKLDLGMMTSDAIIVRTAAKVVIEPPSQVSVIGASKGKRYQSIVLQPDWAGTGLRVIPPTVVKSAKGTTELGKTFLRAIMMGEER